MTVVGMVFGLTPLVQVYVAVQDIHHICNQVPADFLDVKIPAADFKQLAYAKHRGKFKKMVSNNNNLP